MKNNIEIINYLKSLTKTELSDTKSWIITKSDEEAVKEGCYFDIEKAEYATKWIEDHCTLSKGFRAKEKFTPLDWQKYRVFYPLFGWMSKEGRRRFKKAFIFIPKKQGKSPTASAITAFMAVGDNEEGSQCYLCANSKKQAAIVYRDTAYHFKQNLFLQENFKTTNSIKKITNRENEINFIEAMSSDAPSSEGVDAHLIVVDELHSFATGRGTQSNATAFYNSIRYAGAARTQPIFFIITTAGTQLDGTLIGSEYTKAKRVLSNEIIDTRLLPVIYEVPPEVNMDVEENYNNKEYWYLSNPSLGLTISEEDFEIEMLTAIEDPSEWNSFKRYRFNQFGGAESPWMDMTAWAKCGYSDLDILTNLDESKLIGLPCTAGLDLSQTQDITAWLLCFKDKKGVFHFLCRFWIPEKKVKEEARLGRTQYLKWVQAGFLNMCPGAVIEYDWVEEQVQADVDKFKISTVSFDRWGAKPMIQRLEKTCPNEFVEFGQGYGSMSSPTKELMRLVLGERVQHYGHPVLSWMASNAIVTSNTAGDIKIIKELDRNKVDGIHAMIMAIDPAVLDEEPTGLEGDGSLFIF